MINDELRTPPTGKLDPLYQRYERQKCFIAYSPESPQSQDLVDTCKEILDEFKMDPWYESDHFDPTQPLREKVVEMIANTRCGIYDISLWRKDDKDEWHLPCNVFLELGIAIALNRPLLILRHTENVVAEFPLPPSLEGSASLVEFKNFTRLEPLLRERLTQWQKSDPYRDWWNRYCTFGNRLCEHREMHPHLRQWSQEKLQCNVSDGLDSDQEDFRGVIQDVLGNFDNVDVRYLDSLSTPEGYSFKLCDLCQATCSSPFAIYRMSKRTSAETYMAIGMSLALETQFEQKIPKIMRTTSAEDMPSLLEGYDVVAAQDRPTWRRKLRHFTPELIGRVRRSTWKARPLPFISVKPDADERLVASSSTDEASDDYLAVIGKYDVMREIERDEMTVTYLVHNTENERLYALKRLHSNLAADSWSVTRFHREADILCQLAHSHILHGIGQGEDGTVPYVVMEYVEGQTLRELMQATGPLEVSRAINYACQIAEGLEAAYAIGVAHSGLGWENILVDSQNQVKITGFGVEHEQEVDESERTQQTQANPARPYSVAPEVIESARNVDIRSDLYGLAAVFFHMLTGSPPFGGGNAVLVIQMHMSAPVPSLCRERAELPGVFDLFLQKAMAKSPADRYQTPAELLAAFAQLQQVVAQTPAGNRTRVPVPANTQGIPALVGTTLDHYRIFDALEENFFKAFDPIQNRTVTLMVLPANFFEELIRDEEEAVDAEAEQLTLDGSSVQELRALSSLSHPNLVSLYDFGIYDNRLYSVTEYVEGVTLKEKLATGIERQQAVAYMLQAAEGLAYLQAHGLMYPGVEPEIVLLRSDDCLKLPHWEIVEVFRIVLRTLYPTKEAEIEAALTEEGVNVDASSNTSSLGLTLFKCLTSGRSPLMLGYGTTVHIWDLRAAHVPVELQQIVVKMTREKPKEGDVGTNLLRLGASEGDELVPTSPSLGSPYQSMGEVIDALQAALASEEQAAQEERSADNETVGMDRCAFCNAATTSEDELCSNCGTRLLPEPVPTWGQQPANAWGQSAAPAWGQQASPWSAPSPPPPYNPKATRKLNICLLCGEDLGSQSGATVCPRCRNRDDICPYCLAECQPGDNFCLNCGNRLIPPPVQSTLPINPTNDLPWSPPVSLIPQVRYCPACGMPTSNADSCQRCGHAWSKVTACPSCHAIIQPGNAYCISCGKRVAPMRYPPSQGWGASALTFQPSPDPWAAPPAPDSWATQAASPSWSVPLLPVNVQEAEEPTIKADDALKDDADKQELQPDLTGQFNTAWTPGAARSTFSRDDLNNIGKTFGDYRILREIGQGGLGRVYQALHVSSHQPAAVKLFYSHLSAKQHQQLFFLESQVLEHLRHPYILSIIEVSLQEEPRYLITAYAPRGSLHERLQSGQPLPLESSLVILTQVGEALAHIHQHNIVHRDLKPGNILFNEANEALLSDFDIAVVLDTGESKKVDKWGSAPYMAPEQFEGVVSRKSDQYALGCIAYKLVTGRRPFNDSRLVALQFKHATQPPVPPRQLNPTLPELIEQAILRTMAKSPADRFPDIPAFLDALRPAPLDADQWLEALPTAQLLLTEGAWGHQGQNMPVAQKPLAAENNAQPACVLVEIEGKIVKEQLLNKVEVVMGRSSEADIFVPVVSVSRLHASIVNLGNGNYGLRDEGSANGTLLNGQLVPRYQVHSLQYGDRILLAPNVVLTFVPFDQLPSHQQQLSAGK